VKEVIDLVRRRRLAFSHTIPQIHERYFLLYGRR